MKNAVFEEYTCILCKVRIKFSQASQQSRWKIPMWIRDMHVQRRWQNSNERAFQISSQVKRAATSIFQRPFGQSLSRPVGIWPVRILTVSWVSMNDDWLFEKPNRRCLERPMFDWPSEADRGRLFTIIWLRSIVDGWSMNVAGSLKIAAPIYHDECTIIHCCLMEKLDREILN